MQITYLIRASHPEYVKKSLQFNDKKGDTLEQAFLQKDIKEVNKHMERYLPSLAIRELQIKITRRYHFTRWDYHSTRMPVIKKKKWEITNDIKVVEKSEPSSIAGGKVKWCSCHITGPIWPSNSMSMYIPQRIENICLCKNLHLNVHSNIIHNGQKVLTPQIFINWWRDKQDVDRYTAEY